MTSPGKIIHTGKYFPLVIIILLWGSATTINAQQKSSCLVIRNINVIDILDGKILPEQDVVVKDKKIFFIGNSFSGAIPSNAVIIDGNGRYLSPGFWDMHFHLCWNNNNDSLLFPVLLRNGIMGLRDMGGDLRIMQDFKKRIKDGEIVGPEIFGAGPIIDGNPPVYPDFTIPVDDKTNMNAILDSLKNNGADFFKTYSLIKENQLKEISKYCFANNNTSFAGHLSEYIEPEISISLGQKSVEHLNRLDDIWETNKSRIENIANLMLAKKTFLCPTLITYQLKTRVRDTSIVNYNYNKYIPASLMAEWKNSWTKRLERHTKKEDWDNLDKKYLEQKALVNYLNKKGIMLLAGSDFAGMAYVYPGISLSQELSLLVEAGLSNYEALQTATINPAIYLSAQEFFGSISKGKFADMLILEKNPLDNINNIQTIAVVISKGKIYYSSK